MKTIKITSYTLLIIVLSLTSCQEKIDFDLNNQENSRLVVEGSVTDQIKEHVIKLTRTSSYYENEPAPKETGATVTINDGSSTVTLTESDPGNYTTLPTYKGEIGKTYTLNITTTDGEIYTANSTLESISPIDTVLLAWEELLFEEDEEDNGFNLVFYHYGPEAPGIGDNYVWFVNINGENYSKTVSDLMFVTDEYVDGSYIGGFEFFWVKEDDLPQTDTLKILVETHSISKEYHDFLNAIVLETESNGDLFSGPPANIPSNINNGALGFFRASAVASKYIEVKKTDIQ